MAREAALAFFDKLRSDQALRSQLDTLAQRDIPALLRFAAEVGYFFNLRDYRAALEAEGELPDTVRDTIVSGRYMIPGVVKSDTALRSTELRSGAG